MLSTRKKRISKQAATHPRNRRQNRSPRRRQRAEADSHGRRVSRAEQQGHAATAQDPIPNRKPKYDLGKGRQVYPTTDAHGRTVYLPKESDATDAEKSKGLFVKDHRVDLPKEGRQAVKDGAPKKDLGKDRQVYPTKDDKGNTTFLPKESDATDAEKARGLFVKNDSVSAPGAGEGREAIANKPPKYDIGQGRYAYPAKDENGKPVYLPKESEATNAEKSKGLFVKDEAVATPEEKWQPVTHGKPRYDLGKGRYVYPVVGEAGKVGKVLYLPKLEAATDFEVEQRLYLPEEEVGDAGTTGGGGNIRERVEARAERRSRY